ncbi:hypothetical protein RB2654_14405 [Rhodobacterales bacterium HTCC2654]|uniref:Uncharacterized protein n=1 Tax=Maritimibacter alkaliphilus HTCC2654 TaxID=314271 RepID=A3VGT0_9RHOB|nr:hypothetical protein RB2654_14405 [Rhodobacterales bacterium HTCC2654] [Maritimibacter alkaliphilus HTCC2654]
MEKRIQRSEDLQAGIRRRWPAAVLAASGQGYNDRSGK